jgi:high-affinity iron transporter
MDHRTARRLALAFLAALAIRTAAGCGHSSAEVVPAAAAADAPEGASDRARTAERLAALFEYVATDYGGAVEEGRVVSPAEYEEQLRLVDDMRRFASELGAPGEAKIDALEAAIRARAAADLVAERCRALRRETIETFDVVVAPSVPPDRARAEALYRDRCAECHGARGRGDGWRAASLTPRPADLGDPDRMAGVTPYRAYCAITYGIDGTAMIGQRLPDADRWSLAFYAVGLRHEAASRTPPGSPPARSSLGLATLASETDEGLDRLLAPSLPDPAVRAREIARLRAEAPFSAEMGEAPVALARRLVACAREAAREGRRDEADRLALDAYLRGIEALEPVLAARDRSLVAEIETALARFRSAIRAGAPDLDGRATRLLSLLDRAEGSGDRSPLGGLMLAGAAALLVLREGLEAALVVAALFAVVRRTEGARGARRAIHAGWIGALAGGVFTFALARTIVSGLAARREAIEGTVSLLAAAVLVMTSFWLISKADARRWLAYLKERAAGSAAGGSLFGLGSLAFLAVYREAFESVLFFEALAGGDSARLPPLLLGIVAGALPLAAAVYAVLRLERRLPISAFFGASGAALLGLSIVLVGDGVTSLAQAGFFVPRPIAAPRIPWLGIYPDAISLGAQAALCACLATAAILWLAISRARRSTAV